MDSLIFIALIVAASQADVLLWVIRHYIGRLLDGGE